jgi:hypothetical protein
MDDARDGVIPLQTTCFCRLPVAAVFTGLHR